MQDKKADEKKRTYEEHSKKMDEGRKRRKTALKMMLAELKDEKEEMILKREQLKAEYKALPDSDHQKNVTLAKIKKIDVDLQTEYYKVLEERGEEIPSAAVVSKQIAPENMNNDLIMKEYKETVANEEQRVKNIKKEYAEGEAEFLQSEILI